MNTVETTETLTDEALLAALEGVKPEPRMRLKLDPKRARTALAFVSSIIANSTTLPILSMMKCQSNGSTKFVATDLDVTLSAELPDVAEVEGQCMLPKKSLMAAVKSANKSVVIDLQPKLMVDIVTDGFKQTVPTLSVEEFVPYPEFQTDYVVQVSAVQLRSALKRVEMAQSTDATRYVLNGILFEVGPDAVTLIATDGRRLNKASIPRLNPNVKLANQIKELEADVSNLRESLRLIVPSKAIKHLLKMPIDKDNDRLVIDVGQSAVEGGKMIGFHHGPYRLTTKLIDGNYPNYRQVLPTEHKELVALHADQLAVALRHVSTVVTDKSYATKLTLEKNTIRISAKSPEGEAVADLAVSYKGEPKWIAFNFHYLLDTCAAFKGEEVTLKIIDELSPGVFENQHGYVVLMPMRLA